MINKPASVRARLLNKAKSENQDFSLVLTRYGLERLREMAVSLREMLSPCAKSQGPGPSVDSATSRRMTLFLAWQPPRQAFRRSRA